MKNLPIIIILVILVILYFTIPAKEKFSQSGLSLSDADCMKLAEVYYRPTMKDPECRSEYNGRICGKQRRSTIDYRTGNYFTENGHLI